MRKLASLVNVYSKPMNPNPSPVDEGIGGKVSGFSSFSSPKKRSVGESSGYDGFAKIVNKKKRIQSANVGKEDDAALNSQFTKTITEKAGYIEQIVNKKKRGQSANVGKEDDAALNSQVTKTITEKAGYTEQKFFVWRQSDDIIYDGWLANARRKYSEVVCVARSNWENKKEPHNRIGKNVYSSWVKFWEGEEFQKKSLIQKSNRRSGVDGRPSTHTSGSASHRLVAARLKIQYKRNPTADQLFLEAHTRHLKKKRNWIGYAGENIMDDEDEDEEEIVWIDKKSQQTYETFLKLREQHEASGQPVDNNELFLEAVGGPDKKRRVYGVGSSKRLFYQSKDKQPCTSSFTAEEENQKLKCQLIEMNDRMKAMENQLAMIVEATSARVQRA